MVDLWIDSTKTPEMSAGIPEEFVLTGQIDWHSLWTAFELDITAPDPVETLLCVVQQQKDSCFITGSIAGMVYSTCARCAETAPVVLKQSFELFEQLDQPGDCGAHGEKEKQQPVAQEESGPAVLRKEQGVLQINAGQILWEYFLLALPDKILCSADCKGLCPVCGTNQNKQACTCEKQTLDPRLAILRKLKIAG